MVPLSMLIIASIALTTITTFHYARASQTQYHIQTDEGPERYFRYQTDSGQFRKEKRLKDGTVIGTNGWVDPSGYLRMQDYIADTKGYRILKSKTTFVGKNTPINEAIQLSKSLPPQGGGLRPRLKHKPGAHDKVPGTGTAIHRPNAVEDSTRYPSFVEITQRPLPVKPLPAYYSTTTPGYSSTFEYHSTSNHPYSSTISSTPAPFEPTGIFVTEPPNSPTFSTYPASYGSHGSLGSSTGSFSTPSSTTYLPPTTPSSVTYHSYHEPSTTTSRPFYDTSDVHDGHYYSEPGPHGSVHSSTTLGPIRVAFDDYNEAHHHHDSHDHSYTSTPAPDFGPTTYRPFINSPSPTVSPHYISSTTPAPPSSSTYLPPSSSTYLPPSSSTYLPPSSSTYLPPSSSTYLPPYSPSIYVTPSTTVQPPREFKNKENQGRYRPKETYRPFDSEYTGPRYRVKNPTTVYPGYSKDHPKEYPKVYSKYHPKYTKESYPKESGFRDLVHSPDDEVVSYRSLINEYRTRDEPYVAYPPFDDFQNHEPYEDHSHNGPISYSSGDHSFRPPITAIGDGYTRQFPKYNGNSVSANGFRYYLPRQYHEEESLPGNERSGSFGYIDPFGIRRVIYYNTGPGKGFQHRKNNRYVGFNATPYDPRPKKK